MTKRQHVVPQDGRWAVKAEGSSAGTVYKTKKEAIDAAREKASDRGGVLVIHGQSGQIIHPPVSPTTINEDAVRAAIRSMRTGRVKAIDAESGKRTSAKTKSVETKSARSKSASTKSMTNANGMRKAEDA